MKNFWLNLSIKIKRYLDKYFTGMANLIFTQTTGDLSMAKSDVVAAAVAAVQAGELQVLNDQFSSVYDQAVASVPPADAEEQAKIDAAVAAAVAPLNQQLVDLQVKDDADVKAGQDALAILQSSFDALSVKEGQESQVVAGLQASIASIQGALDSLKVLFPAP